MILIDKQGHLVSTESEDELHEFALRIGLRRAWFQRGHYDVIGRVIYGRALTQGANLVPSQQLVRRSWWFKERHKDEDSLHR